MTEGAAVRGEEGVGLNDGDGGEERETNGATKLITSIVASRLGD